MTTQTQASREEYFATHQATQKQIDFVTKLLSEIAGFGETELDTARKLHQGYRDLANEGKFTMAFASKTIDTLKESIATLKSEAKSKIEWPEVPTGRYAYAKSEDPDDIAFFHVVVKDDGFPLLWVYSSDDELPIKGFKQKLAILKKIVELDPFECERLYGQKTEHCSRCGKKLTRPESRAYGMGDKCAGKV